MDKKNSKITLGTVQLGLDYGINNKEGKPSLKKAYTILDAAIESGINSFDTAAGYGDSEIVLGKYFKERKSHIKDLKIITKISIPGNVEISDSKQISNTIHKLIESSLARLKSENVYGVMLHNANNLHKYKEDIASALVSTKQKGYAQKTGVSVYTQKDIDEFLRYEQLDMIQIPINVMDMRLINSGALEKLKKADVEIYARSVFLQGLFFIDPDDLPEKLRCAKVYLEMLREISKETNLTLAEIAIGYVRDTGFVDSLVIGADNPKQVKENIKLINSPSMDTEHFDKIREYFRDVPETVLNPNLWK